MAFGTIVIIFYYPTHTHTNKNKTRVIMIMSIMTHLDFGGTNACVAVHSMESDGVKLSLVQVDHGKLIGLVRRSQGSSQGELELVPESLWRGAGVGAGVDRAGVVLGEVIAVGESLKGKTQMDICQ